MPFTHCVCAKRASFRDYRYLRAILVTVGHPVLLGVGHPISLHGRDHATRGLVLGICRDSARKCCRGVQTVIQVHYHVILLQQ